MANNQLPQDVMHVMLEGVVPYELHLMLTVFIVEKEYFTLKLLNDRIQCYPYTQEEVGDKPSPITFSSSSLTIHQSGEDFVIKLPLIILFSSVSAAAQMWLLSVYLPLIIGSEIPPEEELWECFLLLLSILQITTARIVSPGLAAYLTTLICDHHTMFRSCYPTASITPKMHYMIHFPSQMVK